MNYIIESLFVGLYASFIYLLFSPFIKNFSLLLLVCGFFKHFLGYMFGLWTFYCNYGEACVNCLPQQNEKYIANNIYLWIDSFYEAILFLIFGTLLSYVISSKIQLFLFLGILLHIIAEKIGIHQDFCRKTCDII
jgi:hypothetical protein